MDFRTQNHDLYRAKHEAVDLTSSNMVVKDCGRAPDQFEFWRGAGVGAAEASARRTSHVARAAAALLTGAARFVRLGKLPCHP